MTTLPAAVGFSKWAATYEASPNPLLALEQRAVQRSLTFKPGQRVLDLATGSGRWLAAALGAGTEAFGVDASREMLTVASSKPAARGRTVVGDIRRLPFSNDAFDLAVCSFALSYVSDVDAAFSEFSRVARRIVVSDLHPAASQAGWKRGFDVGGESFDLAYFNRDKDVVLAAARSTGLRLLKSLDACFGEPERTLFRAAHRETAFEKLRAIPAVWVTEWERG